MYTNDFIFPRPRGIVPERLWLRHFKETPCWGDTTVTTEQYLLTEAGKTPMQQMPGYLLELQLHDSMHNLFHAGVISVIVGSVVKELVLARTWAENGDSTEAQLIQAHGEFMHWVGSQDLIQDYDRHYMKDWTPLKFSIADMSPYPMVSTECKCSGVRLMLLWLADKHSLGGCATPASTLTTMSVGARRFWGRLRF